MVAKRSVRSKNGRRYYQDKGLHRKDYEARVLEAHRNIGTFSRNINDKYRKAKRESNIRYEPSYEAWLRSPGRSDLVDPRHPNRKFDWGYEVKRKHSPRDVPRKRSPRDVPRKRSPQTKRKRGFVAELAKKLPEFKVRAIKRTDVAAIYDLCKRPNCFVMNSQGQELEQYLDYSKNKAAIEQDGELIAVVLGSPQWKLPEGDWVARPTQGQRRALRALDADARAHIANLVLICSAPQKRVGGRILQAFVDIVKSEGAQQLALDLGGSCPKELLSWYKRQPALQDLRKYQVFELVNQKVPKAVAKHAYRGIYGVEPATIYMTPI